jgi:transposase
MTRVKLKVGSLLKRYQEQAADLEVFAWRRTKWTKVYVLWLRGAIVPHLDFAVGTKLRLLLDRHDMYRREMDELEKAIKELARTERYRKPYEELRKMPGVGLLVAMTFLTEMGDLSRFHNRREVGAYLGLCPSSQESGETGDRKGRITRQGPARLRKMLCQAAWRSISVSDESKATYHRIRQDQKKRTKKALVALMRMLGVKMWHRAMESGVSPELVGRGGPHELISI